MSRTRQELIARVAELDRVDRPLVAFANDYPAETRTPRHSHRKGQLIHAISGVMVVRTDAASWLVPPGLALWMPPGEEHEVEAVTELRMRTVYVEPAIARGLASSCRVVEVRPLLRELLIEAVRIAPDYDPEGPEGRLMRVLLDQLGRMETTPLHLPMPRDRRLAPVAEALLADPGDDRTIEEWSAAVGASPRTLSRRFLGETGLNFGQWRQRRRVLAALERLAAGEPVTTVALDLGYQSPSAFIAMFRRQLGASPTRYLRGAQAR